MVWQDLRNLAAGTALGVSEWRPLTQQRVDAFAAATDDFQFVHVDVARAVAETPFGGTIAHGFLTLSLISSLACEVLPANDGVKAAMLIAIDRVKFLNPVRVGKRIRGAFRFDRVAWLKPDRAVVRVQVTIEIEGETRPALSCEVSWLVELQPQTAAFSVATQASQSLAAL